MSKQKVSIFVKTTILSLSQTTYIYVSLVTVFLTLGRDGIKCQFSTDSAVLGISRANPCESCVGDTPCTGILRYVCLTFGKKEGKF